MKDYIKPSFIALFVLSGMFFLTSCETALSPRPKGYPRIYFPEKVYDVFDSAQCGYTFSKPVYAKMQTDPAYTENQPCWYNLNFIPFDATLHISYHEYQTPEEYDSLYEDTHKLVYKHIIRADDIEEIEIGSKSDSLSGLIFQLRGNTATNLNFFLTDNSHRYFRGALYFNSKTEPDSIAPVYQFIQDDIYHIITTFKWK
ncbi:MAG: gliding motility lipoprotein GldD [Bacteroidia bacterium]|nr:gliding motility lipoprotein GldD [Bacteroidota bacterium]MCZ2128765.1 gliding motility lipoprotein GldD [Bacteroidia bacterium]